jgi:hypothetical protein
MENLLGISTVDLIKQKKKSNQIGQKIFQLSCEGGKKKEE